MRWLVVLDGDGIIDQDILVAGGVVRATVQRTNRTFLTRKQASTIYVETSLREQDNRYSHLHGVKLQGEGWVARLVYPVLEAPGKTTTYTIGLITRTLFGGN